MFAIKNFIRMKLIKPFSLFLTAILALYSCNIEDFDSGLDDANIALTCPEAAENLQKASIDFASASSDDDNFSDVCNAYKKALENQISACGDPDGSFQTLIDGLSCGNDTPTTQTGVFKVDFDGSTYTADNIGATILDDILNISGFRGNDGEVITLTVFNPSVGTFDLGVTNGALESNAVAYNSEVNSSGSGTWVTFSDTNTPQGELVITKIDEINKTISGTFSFTGSNPTLSQTKEFTNGSFTDVVYNNSLSTGNPSGNNSFFAKVDGQEFVEDLVTASKTSTTGEPIIIISATKNNLQTININIEGDAAPGEYTFSRFGAPSAVYNRSLTDINTGTGKVIITLHDVVNKRIVGTFEFNAGPLLQDPIYSITEGSFDLTYMEF